jgi:Xaa-Pro dipeptidase
MNHQDRLNLLTDLLAAEELDAVIGFSAAAHHVDFGDAVALLSGVKPMALSFAILTKDRAVHLHIAPVWDRARVEQRTTADQIEMANDIGASFEAAVQALSLSSANIGVVDLGRMPHRLAAGFVSALGGTPKSLDKPFFAAAARKTDHELEGARGATEIAEKTYDYLLEIAEPGMKECYLAAELKSFSRAIGSDDNFMMLHAEGHPLAVQPSGERKLEKGDLILAEMTPSYRGQFSQICRTVCVGEPTAQQREKYDLVVTAMMNGISRAKAGVPMKDICLGVDEVLCDNGYAEYCAPPYMNRRGHGLGIASMAPGNVSLNNETILEDGMFFVVHPNQYIPEVGYLLCGEPIIVREDGADVLTKNRAAMGTIPL